MSEAGWEVDRPLWDSELQKADVVATARIGP